MQFGERLRQARNAKGFNQETLGKMLGGTSKQTISHWEGGRYEPNLDQLALLCDVLDTSADWLLLGRSPEGLPPDAIHEGKFYAALSPEGKKKWKAMRLLFVDGATDKVIERRMPVTKKEKSS
jgi:transcriptional regulator with XRE-family HTH domain